jgi:hypothetical protein
VPRSHWAEWINPHATAPLDFPTRPGTFSRLAV